MIKKIINNLVIISYIQIVVYLFGFVNSVARTSGLTPLIDVSYLQNNFYGIIFWSILSMISVIGFVLSLYLMVSKAIINKANIGIIIFIIGFAAPIILSQFLLVPATLLILGIIFVRMLILDKLPNNNDDEIEEAEEVEVTPDTVQTVETKEVTDTAADTTETKETEDVEGIEEEKENQD